MERLKGIVMIVVRCNALGCNGSYNGMDFAEQ